ncbi:MAG: hypothetical protein HQK83_01350 [Fibrobacteria bacterium]|nr:hypothetical protein [Fibrobacteria bacterium]
MSKITEILIKPFKAIKLPPGIQRFFTPLAEIWSKTDKRTIKLFAIVAFLTYILFFFVFIAYFRWNDTTQEQLTAEAFTQDDSLPKSSSSDTEGTQLSTSRENFEPEFIQSKDIATGETALAHKKLMEIYFKNGKLFESYKHSQYITDTYESDSNFLRQITEINLGLGEYKTALEKARAALSFNPDNTEIQAIEIQALYRTGEVNNSLELGESYLKKSPQSLELLTALGTINIETKTRKAGNAKYLQEALTINPNYVPALSQMGRKHKLEGNYADALSYFKKCVKLDPINPKVRGHLGAVYYYLNKDKLAKKEYETALFLNPKDFNTWYNLGELIMSGSYYENTIHKKRELQREAFKAYQNAITHNPSHIKANFRIGVLLNSNRQFKEAIRYLSKVIELDQDHVRAHIQIAAAFEHLKLLEDAVFHLKKAFKLDPNNKTVLYKLKVLPATS